MNFRGQLLTFDKPRIMGILNLTPDSFFEGSRLSSKKELLLEAEDMLNEGATILDIGGVSTRPGAAKVSVEEELSRVIPAVDLLRKEFPEAILSIDTFNSIVADAALTAGANMINDVSGMQIDEELIAVLAKWKVPYILMHMQGTPQTMQNKPIYEDLITEVLDFFIKKLERLKSAGVEDIILDPGFGFGKTVAHNYALINHLNVFLQLDCPLLVGVSRKSMIWKPLGITPDEALIGTAVLHLRALQKGAKLLRVHDVKEANQVIKLWSLLEENK
jgi:dihydropteroate synthase